MFEDLKPHIADLRKRLGISVAIIFVMFFVCFSFWQVILDWMTVPLVEVLPEGQNMIFTAVQEPFFVALKVSFFAAFIVSLPAVFWQVWLFVAPGLYDNEKMLILPFVFFATLMFLMGSTFAYYIVLPLGFEFLVNFGGQMFTALPKIGEYVGFFTKLMIGFGISFEMPVITFFFAKLGLLTDKTLKDFFRYAVIIIFIVASILTPPDVITQFLMAVPMIILYIISIYIAQKVNPAPKEDNEE
jgi:sec-independent protein translocase protein TatC